MFNKSKEVLKRESEEMKEGVLTVFKRTPDSVVKQKNRNNVTLKGNMHAIRTMVLIINSGFETQKLKRKRYPVKILSAFSQQRLLYL